MLSKISFFAAHSNLCLSIIRVTAWKSQRHVHDVFQYTCQRLSRRWSSGSRHQLSNGLLHDCIAGCRTASHPRIAIHRRRLMDSSEHPRSREKGKILIARLSTRSEPCERNRDASGCRGVTNDVVKTRVGRNYSRCIIPVKTKVFPIFRAYFARSRRKGREFMEFRARGGHSHSSPTIPGTLLLFTITQVRYPRERNRWMGLSLKTIPRLVKHHWIKYLVK